jgi:hypothetical protein
MNELLKDYANTVAGYVVSDHEAAELVKEVLEYEREILSEVPDSGPRKESTKDEDANVSNVGGSNDFYQTLTIHHSNGR